MIQVQDLTKYYGPYRAVSDISFTVNDGEIVGFLGPNGAGKTTTMRITTGYIPPTFGTVTVDNFDVTKDSMQVRRRIGYLPETVPLYTDMTPREYLNYMGKLRGMRDGRLREARIEDVMEVTGVTSVASRLIGKLSRGFRQRVGIAQAMLHNPDVLILDEPTVGLDPRQIIEVRELIRELGKSHTIILSTHILPEVSMLCDRVIIINRGRIAVDDTLANLEQQMASNDVLEVALRASATEAQAVLAGVAGVQAVEPLPPDVGDGEGVTRFRVSGLPDSDLRAPLAHTVIAGGYDLLELKSQRLTLEDIFVNITTRDDEEAGDADTVAAEALEAEEGIDELNPVPDDEATATIVDETDEAYEADEDVPTTGKGGRK
ncbi:MAG: hypothetical protein DLM69_00750 [Candidatus Chloroheliales bacterium]|nr:MAG: hypothetical protein DLM69_00750 [Chloroflexota bacterium]